MTEFLLAIVTLMVGGSILGLIGAIRRRKRLEELEESLAEMERQFELLEGGLVRFMTKVEEIGNAEGLWAKAKDDWEKEEQARREQG